LSRSYGHSGKFPWINLVLFALTCVSTTLVGTLLMSSFHNTMSSDLLFDIGEILKNPILMVSGLPFSISIMSILFAHEMGHYLTCLFYGIDATLPYFIPAPTPMGTMGAFIKIRSPFQHRAALFNVGVAGPIAGFVLAVPTLIVGLAYSKFVVMDASEGWTRLMYSKFVVMDTPIGWIGFGEPLIFKISAYLMGKTPPEGFALSLHPVGLAAWFGFLATALNLLPIGQLDGGHMIYALFPGLHKRISQVLVIALVPLGIWYWTGWLLWFVLLLILRLRHPMTMDDSSPLESRHFGLAWFGLAMFVLCFMPTPIYAS
jgi:membrane-associated protease RseP (regulator of RpoE activity)